MKVAITGGSGFVGAELARALLDQDLATVAGAPAETIDEVRLLDLQPPPDDLAAHPRVTPVPGALEDTVAGAFADSDLIFHLAAAVSGAAEADFDLGMRVNLDGTRAVLEAARRTEHRPVLVFASSLAVFGATETSPLPDVVTDNTVPRPQSSYGIQKLIGEQLVADYTRKGFIGGRTVRLQTVAVRPGRPNAAASSFVSGIIREPLAGERAACPVPGDTELGVSSPARTIEGLLRAAATSEGEWGDPTPVMLPSLTTTPNQMIEAMDRVSGTAASTLIDWTPDPAIAAIVTSWPAHFRSARTERLGLFGDPDFDTVVRAYLDRTD